MMRKSYVMQLFPGFEAEYKKRHDELWPELEAVLKSHGVSNFSISLHPETKQLFAHVEIECETRWGAIADTEPCQKWWAYMRDIMETNEDHSPKEIQLNELFFLH